MTTNLFEPTVGVFGRGLNGLETLKDKAVSFAASNNLEEMDVLNWRLYPDMFPLYQQFQIVCDFAQQAPARILGVDVPEALLFAVENPGFEELGKNINDARNYITQFTAEQFEGREDLPITFPIGENEMTLPAKQYLLGFATQNYFFHLVTTYNILRNKGVVLGKRAYFGQPD